jgi:hypothetical protein
MAEDFQVPNRSPRFCFCFFVKSASRKIVGG